MPVQASNLRVGVNWGTYFSIERRNFAASNLRVGVNWGFHSVEPRRLRPASNLRVGVNWGPYARVVGVDIIDLPTCAWA